MAPIKEMVLWNEEKWNFVFSIRQVFGQFFGVGADAGLVAALARPASHPSQDTFRHQTTSENEL